LPCECKVIGVCINLEGGSPSGIAFFRTLLRPRATFAHEGMYSTR
jgi:hypothetical protein